MIILDEPIAQLDPGHADRIYGGLKELNERYGKTIIVIEHHTEYIADYCRHVMLMRDGGIAWKLPTGEALRRVEELQECNIFPPQVTIAAHRMKREGRITPDAPLPTTVEEGRRVFGGLRYESPEKKASESSMEAESAVSFRDVSLSYRSVKGEDYRVFCDNILAEIPHLGMRQKMLAAARDTLLGMTALIVIWCCKCILDYLTEGGTLVFPVTAGSLIAAVLILAAANIIILYLTHDPFDHSRARNVRCTVLILLLAALSICSDILVTVELFRIHLGAAAAAAVILYAIYRTADRYTDTF